MSQHILNEARDIIETCLLAHLGERLTTDRCRERANNAAQALMLLLCPEGQRRRNPGDITDEPGDTQ